MSKITFRADDDLVRRLEEFDASKSEVMREALRAYLDEHEGSPAGDAPAGAETLDELLVDRVDDALERRLGAAGAGPAGAGEPQDVNVNITIEGEGTSASAGRNRKTNAAEGAADPDGETEPDGDRTTCGGCGETLPAAAVYCPNCGEKTSHRVFCDCGDELRSDWAFCPGCGRRTPAADVLEGS
jgi:Arc/MetJ-type ribon-helix-helix transcriptional regulator